MLVVVQEPAGTINPASKQVFVTEPTTFTVEAAAPDGGTISYQWQVSTDNGETWTDIPGATGSTYTIPSATAEDHGKQFRCALTNTVNGVTSKTVYSNAATLYVTSLSITIVKPAGGHDASNPVNISNGSMVIALIEGELDKVARVTIKEDDAPEQEISPVSIISCQTICLRVNTTLRLRCKTRTTMRSPQR